MQVMKHGIEGWIIPLCESEHFENWQDLNAYLHTLMFWESMVKHTEAGPLTERISWLSQNLYHLRNGEQRMAEAMHKNGLCDSLTPVSTIRAGDHRYHLHRIGSGNQERAFAEMEAARRDGGKDGQRSTATARQA